MSRKAGRNDPSEDLTDMMVEPLKTLIRQVLIHRGIDATVLHKVNRRGETVIGIILERRPPI